MAANEAQRATVEQYITKAAANSVEDLYWIDQAQLAALEPEVVGVGGVVSPSTGIVDSHGFMLSLQSDLEAHGGVLALGCAVRAIESGANGNVVHTDDFSLAADWVINSAGLTAPDLAGDTPGAPRPISLRGITIRMLVVNRFRVWFIRWQKRADWVYI